LAVHIIMQVCAIHFSSLCPVIVWLSEVSCCCRSSDVHILEWQDAFNVWRKLMGPTKVYLPQFTAPDSIRGRFGLSDSCITVQVQVRWVVSCLCYLHSVGFLHDVPPLQIFIFWVSCQRDRRFLPRLQCCQVVPWRRGNFKTGTVKLCARAFVHDVSAS
jgi:hypothetical protein